MGGQGRALWRSTAGAAAVWIALTLVFNSAAEAQPAPAEHSGAAPRSPSALELGVVKAINAARANPSAYADSLRRYQTYYHGKQVDEPGHPSAMTTEGVGAVDDAIRYLDGRAPVPPLAPSDGLFQTTLRLVVDLGPKGGLGHVGSDGSTMRQRMQDVGIWAAAMEEDISLAQPTAEGVVRQLIIDDGVPTRGHRTAIFDPGLVLVGVACGPHTIYRYMCVVDFAGGLKSAPGSEQGPPMYDEVATIGSRDTTNNGPPTPTPPAGRTPPTQSRPEPHPTPGPPPVAPPPEPPAASSGENECPWPSGKISVAVVDEDAESFLINATTFATLDDLLALLKEKVGRYDPKGQCGRCVMRLDLWTHGTAGNRAKDLAGIIYFGRDHAQFPGGKTMGEDFDGKMKQIGALMCEGGKVVIDSCNAGFGSRGRSSLQSLADKIGVPVSAPIDEIAACSLFGGIATPYQKAIPKPKPAPPPQAPGPTPARADVAPVR